MQSRSQVQIIYFNGLLFGRLSKREGWRKYMGLSYLRIVMIGARLLIFWAFRKILGLDLIFRNNTKIAEFRENNFDRQPYRDWAYFLQGNKVLDLFG
jgi:hypothetical protein